METLSLLPQYKTCSICNRIISEVKSIFENHYFYCDFCLQTTKWNEGTILAKSKILMGTLEKLLTLFLDNQTIQEATNILKYDFVNNKVNVKMVSRYFEIFNKIVYDEVHSRMRSMMLDGEIEIDETHLFKEKKSSAPHRQYQNSSQWLFGMRKRGSSIFIIIFVKERDKGTLVTLILNHIKVNSKIYSDCYSVYVNNRVTPKTSHLKNYGYIHYFVNHKVEFVSALLDAIHTNTIESLWKEIKTYLRKTRSTKKFLFYIYRYYFTKQLTKNDQVQILVRNLQKENIE